MIFYIISASAIFVSVILGGIFALRFKDNLHLILGFSAGSVIGVAFFDLLPEAFNLSQDFYNTNNVALFIVLGFIVYLILDRFLIPHSNQPFRFIMIANFPKGFNNDAFQHLLSLMKNGSKAGVFIIASYDEKAK